LGEEAVALKSLSPYRMRQHAFWTLFNVQLIKRLIVCPKKPQNVQISLTYTILVALFGGLTGSYELAGCFRWLKK
jgi:hypothetical protein